MLVSIITTSFNSAETIGKTLQTVVAQTHPDIQVVIIDGGSKDGTLEVVKAELSLKAEKLKTETLETDGGLAKQKLREEEEREEKPGGPISARSAFPQSSPPFISASQLFSVSAFSPVIVSEPDGGIYDAMNKGVARATGDIVGILNSDDFYAHDRVIARVVERFEQTGCDALYADCCYVDRIQTGQITRYWKAGRYQKGAFRNGWMPPHPTFFVRKEHYNRLGAYRDEFKSAGDYELLLRFIHKHELSVEYLPEVTVMMRAGGASNVSLKNRLRANGEDREAWRINGLKMPVYTPWLKPLRKISQFWAKPSF